MWITGDCVREHTMSAVPAVTPSATLVRHSWNWFKSPEILENQRTLTKPLGENAIITEMSAKSDAQNKVSPIQRNVINIDDINKNEEIIYFGNIFFQRFGSFYLFCFENQAE